MRITTIPSLPRMPSLLWRGVSGGGEPEPPSDFTRIASTNSTMSIHSGHSLTDSYAHLGPWPGSMRAILGSVGITDAHDKVSVSTIPGSPMSWRWQNPTDIDAREDIGDYDTLMITEGGPPPRTTSEYMVGTLDYLCRFTANTIENGAGNEVILWSIWPALNGPGTSPENPTPSGDWTGFTFRTGLPEYENSFKYMADYATWKMKQLYPSLPEDWRVWLFPGHKWMERVYDDIQNDLVPGITDIQELFEDDIHPSPVGGYGLSCLVASCLYQVNLTEAENVWIMPSYTDPVSQVWPAVSQALAEYFWQIAWEIATDYEPAGMGGTEGAALRWQPSDGDPMPNWTLADPDTGGGGDPDPEPGDLPEFVFTASADDLTDLTAMTGPQPTIEDGVLKFDGDTNLTGSLALPVTQYFVMAVQAQTAPMDTASLIAAHANTTWWQGSHIAAIFNGYINGGTLVAGTGEDGAYQNGAPVGTNWAVFEWWTDGETVWSQLNGGPVENATFTNPLTSMDYLTILNEEVLDYHVAALGICNHVPMPEERAAARAWAQGLIPEV